MVILHTTIAGKMDVDKPVIISDYTAHMSAVNCLDQRGPTTGPHAAHFANLCGQWNNFVQAAATFFFEERYNFGTKKELRRLIPIEDLFFFF